MKSMSLTLLFVGLLAAATSAAPLRAAADVIQTGDVRLEIELVVPEGGREQKPAVVFAVGSGTNTFRKYVEGFTETLLEGIFLPRDIAVLYVNKQGVGESSGNWKWGSIERQADDILAAVAHLQNTPGIDPNAIGIVGHSQGGWVAQLAGSLDPGVAFVISLAGPAVSVREQDSERQAIDMRCQGKTEAEIQRALEREERRYDRLVRVGRWFPFFSLRYASNIFQYDPQEAIRNLTQPTLLAYGEMDNMARPESSRERIDQIFGSAGLPSHITWHESPASDHMFRITNTTCFDYEASLGNPYSQDFVNLLGSWVDGLGISG